LGVSSSLLRFAEKSTCDELVTNGSRRFQVFSGYPDKRKGRLCFLLQGRPFP
jgi:hypothetical protein